MGQGFTRRLAEKGHRVVGFDIDAAKVKAAAAWGVEPAASAAEVAERPTSSSFASSIPRRSRTRRLGPRGLTAARTSHGKTCVDVSTTELDATRRIAAALTARGMQFVDAPVSGGPGAAEGRDARHHGRRRRSRDRQRSRR